MSSRQQQICVTWAIPGMDRYYMVFGVSSGRMDQWYPNRLIRKVFTLPNRQLEAAVGAARAYAQNALFSRMDTHEFNSVRFTLPYLLLTNFDLAVNPDGTLPPEACRKEARVWPRSTSSPWPGRWIRRLENRWYSVEPPPPI